MATHDDRPSAIRAARAATIDALCAGFAGDALGLPELERRLEKARAARTRAELDALLSDIRPSGAVPVVADGSPERSSPEQRRSTGPSTPAGTASSGSGADERRSSSLAMAIMGGTRRAGRWAPPSNMLAMAIMGGVELDFRDAALKDGEVTDINCFAFWGGIEIVVPPDVHVDAHGFALMGAFEQTRDAEGQPARTAPTIRVNGFALMGGVEIKVAERGEKLRRRGG